jgi:hypothetical protein
LLDVSLLTAAPALHTMRGLAVDWERFDTTQVHVVPNPQVSRKLEDLGVEHEAEEYREDPWNRSWTEGVRFAKRVPPCLRMHMAWAQ